jgi:hypothetical protein
LAVIEKFRALAVGVKAAINGQERSYGAAKKLALLVSESWMTGNAFYPSMDRKADENYVFDDS